MTLRDEMLMRLYRECFKDKEIEQSFKEDWFYISQLLEAGLEDRVSNSTLEMIIEWLDDFVE